jgi:hypothetical protein
MMSSITTFTTACHIPITTTQYMHSKPENLMWHEKHMTTLLMARPTATDAAKLRGTSINYGNISK